jgi:hypothetical protein
VDKRPKLGQCVHIIKIVSEQRNAMELPTTDEILEPESLSAVYYGDIAIATSAKCGIALH